MEAFRIRVLRKFNKSLICYPCSLTADHCDYLEGDGYAQAELSPSHREEFRLNYLPHMPEVQLR